MTAFCLDKLQREGAYLLKKILRKYEACSRQYVNFDKSTVFFSTNAQEEDKQSVTRILGVWSANDPERYLSQGGKEVFIKATLQVILTYTMAFFYYLNICVLILRVLLRNSGGRRIVAKGHSLMCLEGSLQRKRKWGFGVLKSWSI